MDEVRNRAPDKILVYMQRKKKHAHFRFATKSFPFFVSLICQVRFVLIFQLIKAWSARNGFIAHSKCFLPCI